MILALVSAITMLYGWWDLARETSLSPLETAKALVAEFMSSDDVRGLRFSEGNKLVGEIGIVRLKTEINADSSDNIKREDVNESEILTPSRGIEGGVSSS